MMSVIFNLASSEFNESMEGRTKYVKAARPVADDEMFTLSVRRSFMRRRASFPVQIRYACQFISFQHISIRVRQVKLRH